MNDQFVQQIGDGSAKKLEGMGGICKRQRAGWVGGERRGKEKGELGDR